MRRVNATTELSEHDRPEKRYAANGSERLDEVEGVLLSILEPKLNKQGPRWGEDIDQYFQRVEEELKERQVGEILQRIQSLEVALTQRLKEA